MSEDGRPGDMSNETGSNEIPFEWRGVASNWDVLFILSQISGPDPTWILRSKEGSSGVTSQTLKRGNDVTIKCHVDLSSRYVPLVQWFHDPNEDVDGKICFQFWEWEVKREQQTSQSIIFDQRTTI